MLFDDGRLLGQGDEVERQGRLPISSSGIGFRFGPQIQRRVGSPDTGVVDAIPEDLDTPVNVTEEDAPDSFAEGHQRIVEVFAVQQIDFVVVPITIEV